MNRISKLTAIGITVFTLGLGLAHVGAQSRYDFAGTYNIAGTNPDGSAYTQLAVTVKRCHDQGRSGWWCLLMLVPFFGLVWLVLDLGTQPGKQDRTPR